MSANSTLSVIDGVVVVNRDTCVAWCVCGYMPTDYQDGSLQERSACASMNTGKVELLRKVPKRLYRMCSGEKTCKFDAPRTTTSQL